ncbi:MAG: hypothetical protein EPO24_03370 [Bacteroidetes bacterium]|nr:MAG: hypothetical protein EPO24_03370 [Bacteroidota bacterium]
MKNQKITKSGQRHESSIVERGKTIRFMEWIFYGIIACSTLLILPDVNDSTILKPYVVFIGCAMLCAFGFYWLSAQKKITVTLSFIHFAALGLILASILSLVRAYNLQLGFQGVLFQTSVIMMMFFGSFLFRDTEAQQRLIRAILITGVFACIVGAAQAFNILQGRMTILASGRDVISTLGNSTYFAGFLVIVIPFALVQLTEKKKILLRGVYALLLLTMLFLLLKTESRIGWAAGVAGILVFIFLRFKNKKVKWGLILLACTGVVILGLLFPDIVRERLSGLFEKNPHSSFTRRLFFYDGAWQAFLYSPVLGNGAGNFILFLPRFRSPDYWIYQSEDIVPHAHNEILELASETGILGLIAFTLVLVFFAIIVKRNLDSSQGQERTMAAGLLAAVTSVLLDNVLSLNLRTIPVAILFWVILGLPRASAGTFQISKEIVIPPIMKRARWLSFILLAAVLVWMIRSSIADYNAERAIIEGNISSWRKNEADAVEKYKKALSYDSTHGLARYFLAASSLQLQRYDEARFNVSILIKDYPYYPKSYLIAALSSFEQEDTAVAIQNIKREIELENSPQPYYYYAYFAGKSGDKQLERELLFTMLERNIEGNTVEFVERGIEQLQFLCSTDSLRNAYLKVLREVRERFAEESSIQLMVAESLIKLGLKDEATSIAKDVESREEIKPEIFRRLNELKDSLASVDSTRTGE